MKKVTMNMVRHWLSDDDSSLEIIMDLANGDYKPEILRTDIIETCIQNMNEEE